MGQVAGNSILDWIWYLEDLAGKVTEALGKEVSLIKVAVQALPGVIVVSVFAVTLRLVLHRAPISKRLVTFAISYAFGAQACGLFITSFGFVVLATVAGDWTPPGGTIGNAAFSSLLYAGLFGGLGLSFLSPLYFVLSGLRFNRMWRSSKALTVLVGFVVVVEVFLGHLAVLAAMKLPTYVIARAASPSFPELRLREVTYKQRGGQVQLSLKVLLKNRAATPQGWETSSLKVALFEGASRSSSDGCSGKSYDFKVASVLDGSGTPASFKSATAGETLWLVISATATVDSVGQRLFASPGEWDVLVSMSSTENVAATACSSMTLKGTSP